VSVIIPVCNGAGTLQACLDAVSRTGTSCECIVVDDGSTDASAQIARRAGVRVIDAVTRGGPARARNIGARAASGEILLFIDADVCVHQGTIARAVRALADDSSLDAVIGSYDFEPAEPNFLSQYKNLFHSFVHHHGCRDASTFWTGCGAIRRSFFLQAGGFPEQWKRPSVEDIAFGAVICRLGGRIRLDPDIQVKHLKRWSLAGLLRTDIFDRAIPWTVLMLRNRAMPNDLNLRIEQRFCVALVCIAAVLAVRFPALSGLAILLAILLNLALYRFFASKRGWPFAVRTVPVHLLYFLYSGLAMVTGAALYAVKTEPQTAREPAAKAEPMPIPPEIGV
jgi:glycosyltransferase involved in cell wall biosynthesis